MSLVKSTSIDSYYQHVIDGKARTQREKIYDCISQSSIPLTRRGISALTRIEINAVCGRVNSLIEAGLVQVALIARSGVTGKKVEYLEAILPIAKQRKFDL